MTVTRAEAVEGLRPSRAAKGDSFSGGDAEGRGEGEGFSVGVGGAGRGPGEGGGDMVAAKDGVG